jgi:Fur family transcriptional regulator, peroxide stress response regulator
MQLSPAELSQRLRAHGLRVTPQRLHIYGALAASGEHLTPDGVMEAVRPQHPSISLNTVYEVLETLTTLGVIQRADVGAGSRRYDANMEPHHHLVCRSCGSQADIPCGDVSAGCIDGNQLRGPGARGFHVESAQITVFGKCADCARVNAKVNNGGKKAAVI